LARHPRTSLQICWIYHNKFAGSGDVVIRKQGLSTVDTHVLVIAITLASFSYLGCRTSPQGSLDLDICSRPHRNQILLGGRYQRAHRLLPPDLHASCRISQQSLGDDARHDKRLTSIVGTCMIVCHQRASPIPIYYDQWPTEAGK